MSVFRMDQTQWVGAKSIFTPFGKTSIETGRVGPIKAPVWGTLGATRTRAMTGTAHGGEAIGKRSVGLSAILPASEGHACWFREGARGQPGNTRLMGFGPRSGMVDYQFIHIPGWFSEKTLPETPCIRGVMGIDDVACIFSLGCEY